MTRNPVTVAAKSRAIDALRAMNNGGFRHVPVTEDGTVKGVVSRADLRGMELTEFRWQESGPPGGSERTCRDIAHIIEGQKPLGLGESETVQHACQRMQKRKIGSALVVDRQQRLSGIFTDRDAVRVPPTVEDAGATPVAEAMTRTPVTTTPKDSAVDALRSMNDGGFRHLPVVAEGKILGVVSRSGFTGIEIDRLDEDEHLKEVIW